MLLQKKNQTQDNKTVILVCLKSVVLNQEYST